MRVAVILLACFATLAVAQFQDEGGFQRGPPGTHRRFQRLPSPRPVAPTQSVFVNQRIRRPISFRPRLASGADDGLGIGPAPFPSGKPIRPHLPSAPALSLSHHVKPVNEEPEEDDRGRETIRDRNDREDEPLTSSEEEESVEDSEENVARAIANLGAVGSGVPRTSGGPAPAQLPSAPIQYRPYQGSSLPTGRGGTPPPPPPPPAQYRPAPKPNKPRKQVVEENFKQQVKPSPKPVKPSQVYDSRGKKPVAQIIRRYRNDNADGSITWGFENDDGSYKEEIIGIDCITRGKYGYIDPDGVRREYTYETGIKCDEEQREEDEENGFVDYQENKLVLPNGKTVDLSTMGKKQARRPGPIYGN